MTTQRYVVIFKAKTKSLDATYLSMAKNMREKALNKYNCQLFEAVTELDFEIALSYWNSLDDIHAWHIDTDHQIAQKIGKEKWYSYFSVEICEILKSYQSERE